MSESLAKLRLTIAVDSAIATLQRHEHSDVLTDEMRTDFKQTLVDLCNARTAADRRPPRGAP